MKTAGKIRAHTFIKGTQNKVDHNQNIAIDDIIHPMDSNKAIYVKAANNNGRSNFIGRIDARRKLAYTGPSEIGLIVFLMTKPEIGQVLRVISKTKDSRSFFAELGTINDQGQFIKASKSSF